MLRVPCQGAVARAVTSHQSVFIMKITWIYIQTGLPGRSVGTGKEVCCNPIIRHLAPGSKTLARVINNLGLKQLFMAQVENITCVCISVCMYICTEDIHIQLQIYFNYYLYRKYVLISNSVTYIELQEITHLQLTQFLISHFSHLLSKLISRRF